MTQEIDLDFTPRDLLFEGNPLFLEMMWNTSSNLINHSSVQSLFMSSAISAVKTLSVVAAGDAQSQHDLAGVVFLPVSSAGMLPSLMCTYSK